MNIQIIDDKRKELRYTVTEFCNKIGIDRTTYYKLLEDPDKMKISTWKKMVELLELNATERKATLL